MSARYCRVPYPPTECQLSHGPQQSLSTVRKTLNSADTQECFVEYVGDKHSCMDGYTCYDVQALDIYVEEHQAYWFMPLPWNN